MASQKDPAQKRDLLLMHISVLLAGCTGLCAKLLTVHPAVSTAGRTIFAVLTLFAFSKGMRIPLKISHPRAYLIIALSGVALAAHWIAFFLAIQLSTVAIGVIGFSSFPLFVTFLEPLFFKNDRLTGTEIISAVLIVAGLFLVTPGFEMGDRMTQGLLWGVFSGFTIAIVSILGRMSVSRYHPVAVVFHQQYWAGLAALPFAIAYWKPLPTRDLWLIIALGVVFTGISHTMMAAGLRTLRARTVGVLLGLEPVYSILLAWLLLKEIPGLRTLAGGILICGVVFFVSTRKTAPSSH